MSSKNKKNRSLAVPAEAPQGLSTAAQTLAWVSLGWAVFVIYQYWMHFSWMATLPEIPPLAPVPTQWKTFGWDIQALVLMLTTLAGSAAFGSYLLRPFHLAWSFSLEEKVFSLGLGLAALGYLLFTLGLLQLYRPPVFWGLWATGLLLAWNRYLRGRSTAESVNAIARPFTTWHAAHRNWWPQMALLWIVLAIACAMAFVPEVFYDSMVYHLGVPNWYLKEGGITYYPAIHAQFPFLRQMLNVWGLALQGERLAKLLHVFSAPLIIATYHVLARRYSFPKTTLIAALALFSMPMVNLNLWTAGIDIGLTSFTLLSFLAWLNGLTDTAQRGRWFTLAGLFGGFCFSSKYPGLISVACLCITTVLWLGFVEKNWKSAIVESGRIGLIALGVTLPWLIKSWVFTGNPVYPYLFHLFKSRDLFPDRAMDFMADTQTGAKHHLLDLVMTPWTQTLTGVSSFSAPGIFLLGLLAFLAVALWRKDIRHNGYTASAVFFGLYWICINSMTDRIRLGIPGIAVGCFLLAHPVGYFYKKGGAAMRTAIAALVAFGAFSGILSMLSTISYSYVPWNVLAGRETAEAYLSYTHPGLDPYPAMNAFVAAKALVPPGHRLLIVGDEKTSLCPVPYLASGVHNNSVLVQWSRDAQSVEDLVQRFESNKVSHLLLNTAEAHRLSGYKILDWDDRSLALYCAFFEKHLRLVKQAAVVERFINQSTPLLIYEFTSAPPSTPPSDNVLLALYEDFRVASSDPLVAKKRAEILEKVDRAYPGLATVQQQLLYWQSLKKAPHAH